jgi:hypothetical protein
MRRSATLAAVVASLTVSAPAVAVPPTQERVTIDETEIIRAGDLCAFPLEFRATGRILVTTRFDQDGTVDSISERPNIRLDKTEFNPDGTAHVLSTGASASRSSIWTRTEK